jgi:hypothetical protein
VDQGGQKGQRASGSSKDVQKESGSDGDFEDYDFLEQMRLAREKERDKGEYGVC